MLGLASAYPKRVLIGPKPGFFLVVLFCCQYSLGATIDSTAAIDANIKSTAANIDSLEAIIKSTSTRAERIEVNYSAGLLVLPEWVFLPVDTAQLVLEQPVSSSSGDIALTVAEINLLVSKKRPEKSLQLILSDCSGGSLACVGSNALPLTALAWLFAPGILGLIGVQRRVWESGGGGC